MQQLSAAFANSGNSPDFLLMQPLSTMVTSQSHDRLVTVESILSECSSLSSKDILRMVKGGRRSVLRMSKSRDHGPLKEPNYEKRLQVRVAVCN